MTRRDLYPLGLVVALLIGWWSAVAIMLAPVPYEPPESLPYTPVLYTEYDMALMYPEGYPPNDHIGSCVPAADPEELTILAQTLWGEARGVASKERQAAVIWCILNRVDDPRWPDSVREVCIQSQFHGYDPSHPVDPELYQLAHDVYIRWQREKHGDPACGRVLPKEYVYFHGDGVENHFRIDYSMPEGYWDWSFPDPYGEEVDYPCST